MLIKRPIAGRLFASLRGGGRNLDRHAVFVDQHPVIGRVEILVLLVAQYPVGQSHFGIEALDRALGDGDAHIIGPSGGRRAASLQPADRPGVVAAHPHRRRQAARKSDEPAVLVAVGGARLARHRATDLRRAARPGVDRSLHQVGDPCGDPVVDQLGRGFLAMLVEQVAIGGRHLGDRIGGDRHALALDRRERLGHVDDAHFRRAEHHRGMRVDRRGYAEPARHVGDRRIADLVADLRGDGIDRIGKGGADRYLAAIAAA